MQDDLDARVGLCERLDQVRVGDRGRQAQVPEDDRALPGPRQRLRRQERVFGGGQGRPRLLEEDLSGGSERDPAGVPLEQLQPEVRLELGHRLRERRLGDVQLLRGKGDLALFCDRHEVLQVAPLERVEQFQVPSRMGLKPAGAAESAYYAARGVRGDESSHNHRATRAACSQGPPRAERRPTR